MVAKTMKVGLPGLALGDVIPDSIVPVPDPLRVAEEDLALPRHADADGQVPSLVQQLHPLHLAQLYLVKGTLICFHHMALSS